VETTHLVTSLIAQTAETPEGREVNSHTFIGLGLMASVLVVIWLIRRSRA
jgi:hypothetical protein